MLFDSLFVGDDCARVIRRAIAEDTNLSSHAKGALTSLLEWYEDRQDDPPSVETCITACRVLSGEVQIQVESPEDELFIWFDAQENALLVEGSDHTQPQLFERCDEQNLFKDAIIWLMGKDTYQQITVLVNTDDHDDTQVVPGRYDDSVRVSDGDQVVYEPQLVFKLPHKMSRREVKQYLEDHHTINTIIDTNSVSGWGHAANAHTSSRVEQQQY